MVPKDTGSLSNIRPLSRGNTAALVPPTFDPPGEPKALREREPRSQASHPFPSLPSSSNIHPARAARDGIWLVERFALGELRPETN